MAAQEKQRVGVYIDSPEMGEIAHAGVTGFLEEYAGVYIHLTVSGPGAKYFKGGDTALSWHRAGMKINWSDSEEQGMATQMAEKSSSILVISERHERLKALLSESFDRSEVPLGLLAAVPYVKNQFWYVMPWGDISDADFAKIIQAAYQYRLDEVQVSCAQKLLFADGCFDAESVLRELQVRGMKMKGMPETVELLSAPAMVAGGIIAGTNYGFSNLAIACKAASSDNNYLRTILRTLGLPCKSVNPWEHLPGVALGFTMPIFIAPRDLSSVEQVRQCFQYMVKHGGRAYLQANKSLSSV